MTRKIAHMVLVMCMALLLPCTTFSKPTLPVSVTLGPVTPLEAYTGGEVVELEALVQSVRAMRVRLEFSLRGGVRLVSGRESIELDLSPGEPVSVLITVSVPLSGKGRVDVSVRNTRGTRGRGFTASDSFRFAPVPDLPDTPGPRVRTGPDGRKISEYPVGR